MGHKKRYCVRLNRSGKSQYICSVQDKRLWESIRIVMKELKNSYSLGIGGESTWVLLAEVMGIREKLEEVFKREVSEESFSALREKWNRRRDKHLLEAAKPHFIAKGREMYQRELEREDQEARGPEVKKAASCVAEILTSSSDRRGDIQQRLVNVILWNSAMSDYMDLPEPPLPFGNLLELSTTIPNAPGVYFLWRHERIEYVGRSVKLNNRLTPSHQALLPSDGISWLEFSKHKICAFEATYIKAFGPLRNSNSEWVRPEYFTEVDRDRFKRKDSTAAYCDSLLADSNVNTTDLSASANSTNL